MMKNRFAISACIAGLMMTMWACSPLLEEDTKLPDKNETETPETPETPEKPEEVEMPVVGLQIPAEADAGETFLIRGEGFPADSEIYLKSGKAVSAQKITLRVEPVNEGVRCFIPENTPGDFYNIFLVSGKNEWLLSKLQFQVHPKVVVPDKRLLSLKRTIVLMGQEYDARKIDFTYTGNAVVPSKIVDMGINPAFSDIIFRIAVTFSDTQFSGSFSCDEGLVKGDQESFDMTLANGYVKTSTYALCRQSQPQAVVEWEYDEDGKCLTMDRTIAPLCKFSSNSVPNNPKGADVLKLIHEILLPYSKEVDAGITYAAAAGLLGKNYPQVPEEYQLKMPSETGGFEMVPARMSYKTDADGYITRVFYKISENESGYIYFTYDTF